MTRTRLLHISDSHLPPREDGADSRPADFAAAFERAVALALERDVDAVVYTGDCFDDPRLARSTESDWADMLGPLQERGIPIYAIGGERAGTDDEQWIDPVRRTDAVTRLGREPKVVADTALYGIDAVRPHDWWTTDLTLEHPPPGVEWTMLCMHELLDPPSDDVAVGPLLDNILGRVDIDIDGLALSGGQRSARARLEGTGIREADSADGVETGETTGGSVELLTIDEGTITRQQLALETGPVVAPTITFDGGEGIAGVRAVLDRHDLTDAVATIELVLEADAATDAEAARMARDAGVIAVDFGIPDRADRATDVWATELLQPAQNALETAALLGFRRRSGRETATASGTAAETGPAAGTMHPTEPKYDDRFPKRDD